MLGTRKPLFQTCYFVTSIEDAIRRWNRLYGAGPFACAWHHRMETLTYRGRQLDVDDMPDLSYALGYAGDLMIQFTQQHDDRPSVYRDMYAAGQEGLHHVAYLTDDLQADYDRLEAMGFPCAFRFTTDGAEGAYFDTRPEIGYFTEIHSNPPDLLAAFAQWKQAHEQLRPGDPLTLGG